MVWNFRQSHQMLAEAEFVATVAADRFTLTSGEPLEIAVSLEARNGFDGEVVILKDLFALLSDDEKSVSRRQGFSRLAFKRVAQSRTTSTDCLA